MKKQKFYSLDNILSKKAQYNIIFGERSNGKTYAVLEYGLKRYIEKGEQMAIVRRWQDDFVGKRGVVMFDSLVSNNVIFYLTNGEWTSVYYYGGKWYLCKYTENNTRITDIKPFCYGFSLTAMEHDKSTSYPEITTICFDEFLSRSAYIPDEFVLFMNVLSTIIRQRDNVKIFMLGNTVNKYCPYFSEMGLTHIKNMEPGTIDIYSYGDSKLKVAVEYTASIQSKKSDVYFAFNNPKLSMIKSGTWEIDIYPHCPVKYLPKDILFIYFIEFNGDLLQCEIVSVENMNFTFIHRKTGEIKNPETDLLYSTEISPLPNRKTRINKPTSTLEKKIAEYFIKDKVFYADNEVGEIVRNYLLWCKN